MRTIYHLEMQYPHQLKYSSEFDTMRENAEMVLADREDFQFNKEMYSKVGGDYGWKNRLIYTDDEWAAVAKDPLRRTYKFMYGKILVGYAELVYYNDRHTYIAYFGLLPEFHGRGLGSLFLTLTIEKAWENYTQLVTVNTCSLDSVAALPNYLARGFKMYRVEKASC